MKKITMSQLKRYLRESRDSVFEDDAVAVADPAVDAAAPAEPAAAPAPVDPAITQLVQQLAELCGLQVVPAEAPAAEPAAEPAAPAPVAERRRRLAEARARARRRRLAEARARARRS